jgi:hypothetical protein
MKTMYKGVVNSPETFLKENLVQGATIMYVADGSVFGTLPTLAVIGDDESAETVLVESVDSGAYTIKRAFEGTAKDWTKGATVARNFTNYDYQAVIDNIDELSKKKIPSKLSELTDDSTHRTVTDAQRKAWDGKVDEVTGKGLSTNDYTDEDKAMVNVNLPREIQALGASLGQKADEKDIKTKLSEMIDDSTHRTVTDAEKSTWNNKVDKSQITDDYLTYDSETIPSSKALAELANLINESFNDTVNKSEIADFKRCVVLTQTQYNNLSSTEKNRADTLYFIKE